VGFSRARQGAVALNDAQLKALISGASASQRWSSAMRH
jgi:hypothetical protein